MQQCMKSSLYRGSAISRPFFNPPFQIEKRSCVPLGGTGCENNNGNCCREGNDNYTGKMRKCVNVGDFENR